MSKTAALEFEPTQAAVQQEPYPYFRRLRDEARVYFIDPLNAYGLFRCEDCKNTFVHPERYPARDFIKQAFGDLDPVPEVPSLIAMDPPQHTPLRKLAGQAFRSSLTRALEPKTAAIVASLNDEIAARGRDPIKQNGRPNARGKRVIDHADRRACRSWCGREQ